MSNKPTPTKPVFEPVKAITLTAEEVLAINLPAGIKRDLNGQVGAILTHDAQARKATLLGYLPLVERLMRTGGSINPTQVLSHLALGWPEDWITDEGPMEIRPKRVRFKDAVVKPAAPQPDPWVAELLAALDRVLEGSHA